MQIFFPSLQRKSSPLGMLLILLSSLVVVATSFNAAYAANRTSLSSGNWSDKAIWSGNKVPANGDNVFIDPDHIVVMDVNSPDINDFTIRAGGILRSNGTGKTLRVGKAGGDDFEIQGLLDFTGPTSATLFLKADAQWTGSGVVNLDILDMNTKKLRFGAAANLTINISGAGDPILRASDLTSPLTVTWNYNGTSPQTLSNSNKVRYGNLMISNPAGVSLGMALATPLLDGNLTLQSGFLSNAGFTITGNSGRTFSVANGATYRMTSTTGMVTGFTAKTFAPNSTVEYAGTNQTVSPELYGNLVLGGSGTKTMPASPLTLQGGFSMAGTASATSANSMTVSGDFVIGPTASFSGNSFSYAVNGNWVDDGTFICGGSSITFAGTTTQTVSGSEFCQVTVNNPSGVSLASNLTIKSGGTIILTQGTLFTGPYTLLVNNPSASAVSFGSGRIAGSISRSVAPGESAPYNLFSPNTFITPNGVNNPSQIDATVFPNTIPPGLPVSADTNMIARRYYAISATGTGSGFGFTIRLAYEDSEVRGNESRYTLWKTNAATWVDAGAAVVDPTNNYVEQTGLSSFSLWAIGEQDAALPIQLAYFNAQPAVNVQDVHITWGTITETNNYGFLVQQRIGTSGEFSDIQESFTPGQGTTVVPHDYEWTHHNVAPGTYYYRLKQVDLDGTQHFSESVEVVVEVQTSVGLEIAPSAFRLGQNFPNPFNPTSLITFTVSDAGLARVRLYDITGQQVATVFEEVVNPGATYTAVIDGSTLPSGTYFYSLSSGGRTALRKMLLLK